MAGSPKVSVILPAFNSEAYIHDAIQSILAQTFTDFELLIYNDGSTDKTHEIITSFTDDRIIYKNNEKNSGYLNLLNDGLSTAKGKYIARMDSDDIALPNRFEEQVSYLDHHTDVGICGTWMEFIGKMSGVVKTPVSFEEIQYALFFGCPLTHPTVMMRNDLLSKYNLRYKPEYYYAEDHYLFAEGSHYFKIVNLPMALLKYRIHSTQIGSAKWKEQFIVKSNIQAKLFHNAINNATQSDFDWLKIFFEETSITDEQWLNEVEIYKAKIIEGNKTTKFYPQQILENATNDLFGSKIKKNFFKYFFQKYYNQKRYNLSLLAQFVKEKQHPQKYIGKKNTLFFIVKCLIGYKKKNVIRL